MSNVKKVNQNFTLENCDNNSNEESQVMNDIKPQNFKRVYLREKKEIDELKDLIEARKKILAEKYIWYEEEKSYRNKRLERYKDSIYRIKNFIHEFTKLIIVDDEKIVIPKEDQDSLTDLAHKSFDEKQNSQ